MNGPTIEARPAGYDREHHASVDAWVDHARRVAMPDGAAQQYKATESWDFGCGWAGALQLVRDGWPAGAGAVMALASRWAVGLASSVRAPALCHDFEGFGWDLDAVLRAEPDAWLAWQEHVDTTPGVVRLVANMGASSAVSAQSYTRRGAAVAAVAWLLESAGRPVELIAVEASAEDRNERLVRETVVRVKEAGAPLDIDRVAFVLSHPAALRRISFGVMEGYPADVRRALEIPRGGYGYPANVAADERGDVYVEAMRGASGPWSSDDGAAAWVEAQLRTAGVLR